MLISELGIYCDRHLRPHTAERSPKVVGGTRWSGVNVSSLSCLAYNMRRSEAGGALILLMGGSDGEQ